MSLSTFNISTACFTWSNTASIHVVLHYGKSLRLATCEFYGVFGQECLRSLQVQNRVINHIAIAVTNAQKAAEWYSRFLGFQLIGNIIHHIARADHPDASTFGIYPESLQELKVGCMATGNGVGLEIIEFANPETWTTDEFKHQKAGYSYICITDSDPAALAVSLVAAGGKRLTTALLSRQEVNCLHVTDPWGNVIEIRDTNFDRFASLTNAGQR